MSLLANLYNDTRATDTHKWDVISDLMMRGAAQQYDSARIDYAMNIELGARVSASLSLENDW